MSMLQVRDLPEETHQELRVRAVKAGQSLSAYAARILVDATKRPTLEEFFEGIAQTQPRRSYMGSSEIIREERDSL